DVAVGRAGDLGGAIGQRIGRVLEVFELAGSENGLGRSAARQALAWLLWPAVAADGASGGKIVTALWRWEEEGAARLSVTCLLPRELIGRVRGPLRIGKHPATVLPLDVDLFNRLLLAG